MKHLAWLLLLPLPAFAASVQYCTTAPGVTPQCFTVTVPDIVCPVPTPCPICPGPAPCPAACPTGTTLSCTPVVIPPPVVVPPPVVIPPVIGSVIFEDFATDRINGSGMPLFDVYNGEDPGQTRSIVNGQLVVVGAKAGCGGSDCGVYMHFFPYGTAGYTFPSGYAQSYVKGTWSDSFNRMSLDVMCSKSQARNSDGSSRLELGTYIRPRTSTDINNQGAHYYHIFDPNFYAGRWMRMEMTRVPQHQVGADPNLNWPDNPDAFRNLTRWYWDTQGAWSGQVCTFDNIAFSTAVGEPETYVAARTITYSGTAYEVSWAGPKNQAVTYNVRYSPISMKAAGFASGVDGGTVQNSGNAYTGVFWRSPPLIETGLCVAIQPQGQTAFAEVCAPKF